jgi:hypothetical protein
MSVEEVKEKGKKDDTSFPICECGGEMVEMTAIMPESNEYGQEIQIGDAIFKCVECGKAKTVERWDSEQGMEDHFEDNVADGAPDLEADGQSAPLSVPYQQLLDIYDTYEKGEIGLYEALWLIMEGESYIESKLEFLEKDNEDEEDSLEINSLLIQGLHLLGEGYEQLGEYLAEREGKSASVGGSSEFGGRRLLKSYGSGERRWGEIAREGETLLSQANEKLATMRR